MEKTSFLAKFHENQMMDGEPQNEPAPARPDGRFHSSNGPPKSLHTMSLASLCFRTAVTIALIGFGLGIAMGMAEDFTLAPVHAHVNLLGYVSFFLYGAFYAVVPCVTRGHLPRIHYGLALTGAALMTSGLAASLLGYKGLLPVIAAGAFTVYAGLLVFAWIVYRARFAPMEPAK